MGDTSPARGADKRRQVLALRAWGARGLAPRVLDVADGGWAVIDPHAVPGDPAAETWILIDPRSPVDTPDATRAFARAAGLDEHRAEAWTRVRTRAEALEGGGVDAARAARLHATADALTG